MKSFRNYHALTLSSTHKAGIFIYLYPGSYIDFTTLSSTHKVRAFIYPTLEGLIPIWLVFFQPVTQSASAYFFIHFHDVKLFALSHINAFEFWIVVGVQCMQLLAFGNIELFQFIIAAFYPVQLGIVCDIKNGQIVFETPEFFQLCQLTDI